jgi:hypothetical protein
MAESNQNWRDILWREWRNSEDKEYADQLLKILASRPTFWQIVFPKAILNLTAGLGSMREAKWRNYDPSESIPLVIAIPLGLTAGLVMMVISGLASGLVLGLIVGGISCYTVMTFLIVSSRSRERLAILFDRLYKREEPSMIQVEIALKNMNGVPQKVRLTWSELLYQVEKQRQQPDSLDRLISDLQMGGWVTHFIAHYGLVSWGGLAVETLRTLAEDNKIPLNRVAVRLLKNIERETTARWAENATTLLCPHCLARCQAHQVHLTWQPDLSFYGCRVCSQSREFLEEITHVVAVLDAGWTEAQCQQNGVLRVNWLQRQSLFDFDQVEIIQAGDEAVERFAVQVGNDTDPFHELRYPQMSCALGPDCHLSENTLRILRRTFGEVITHAPHL